MVPVDGHLVKTDGTLAEFSIEGLPDFLLYGIGIEVIAASLLFALFWRRGWLGEKGLWKARGVTGETPQPEPQPVLGPLTSAAMFLVVTISAGGEGACRDLLADWSGLQRAVGFRAGPGRGLACIAGLSAHGWDILLGGRARPGCTRSRPWRATATRRRPRPGTCCSISGQTGWICASSSPPR